MTELPPMTLATMPNHNSIMVPGERSVQISKEISTAVKSPDREGEALSRLALEDVWMHVHGEQREEAIKGCTFPSRERRIDTVHLSPGVIHEAHHVYLVTTSADHKQGGGGGDLPIAQSSFGGSAENDGMGGFP